MALLLRRAEKVWESDGSPRFSLAFAKLVFFWGGGDPLLSAEKLHPVMILYVEEK